MGLEKVTFYCKGIKEIREITNHIKKLDKNFLQNLQYPKQIGIDIRKDSEFSNPTIRIYPLNADNITWAKIPKKSEVTYPTKNQVSRFTYKGVEYIIWKNKPKFVED